MKRPLLRLEVSKAMRTVSGSRLAVSHLTLAYDDGPAYLMCAGAAVHLAADGKYAFIGAPKSSVSTAAEAGTVYVLSKGGSETWIQSPIPLAALDFAEGDNFGEIGNGQFYLF